MYIVSRKIHRSDNMKYCKNCRKKPKLERRVNCEGVVFCSDDCYEEYGNSPNDNDHPYINDYDLLRLEYIEYMKNYKIDIYKSEFYRYPKREDYVEDLAYYLESYLEYYLLEGMDGVFSAEIYNYLIELEDLKEVYMTYEVDSKGYNKWYKEMCREKKEKYGC